MDLGTRAQAFATGLSMDAVSLEEVVQWADQQIEIQEHPSEALIALSLASSAPTALSALNALAINPDKPCAARLLIGHMHSALQAGRITHERISETLYQMWLKGEVPEKNAESSMMAFWDELDLANCGTYGDPEDVKKEIRAFLSSYAS